MPIKIDQLDRHAGRESGSSDNLPAAAAAAAAGVPQASFNIQARARPAPLRAPLRPFARFVADP